VAEIMKILGYKIASIVALGLCALAWVTAYFGWWLPNTAVTRSERESRGYTGSSLRTGVRYYSGGTHFGK
jgi:hypothetical protein